MEKKGVGKKAKEAGHTRMQNEYRTQQLVGRIVEDTDRDGLMEKRATKTNSNSPHAACNNALTGLKGRYTSFVAIIASQQQ
ncbi:unnamed protein product [Ceratitis capitata]|uniref:(Mediterranean fruit fly) hypothetical protein n=1 Tax=Ceratitis capitata TaxID=7213 RepID=A0A811U0T9_CERCA|nr:unnamed protein product [Ceratitis capitata]